MRRWSKSTRTERATTRLLADRIHRPLPAAPGENLDARLLVRDWERRGRSDTALTLALRTRYRLGDARVTEHVWFQDGFELGRIYQLVYETHRAPVAGLGLSRRTRTLAAFLRTPSATNPSKNGFRALILYGISQTGRMQRHFLSLGLNLCEDGSPPERPVNGSEVTTSANGKTWPHKGVVWLDGCAKR